MDEKNLIQEKPEDLIQGKSPYPSCPFICPRCYASFKTSGHINQHVQRLKPCPPIVSCASKEECLDLIHAQPLIIKKINQIGSEILATTKKDDANVNPLGNEDLSLISTKIFESINSYPALAPFIIIPFVWGRYGIRRNKNISGFAEENAFWRVKMADPWCSKNRDTIIPFISIAILRVMTQCSSYIDDKTLTHNLDHFLSKIKSEEAQDDDIKSTFTELISNKWDDMIKIAMEYEWKCIIQTQTISVDTDDFIEKMDLEDVRIRLKAITIRRRKTIKTLLSFINMELKQALEEGLYGEEQDDIYDLVKTSRSFNQRIISLV